jgi:hypothetical protein
MFGVPQKWLQDRPKHHTDLTVTPARADGMSVGEGWEPKENT